MNRKTQFIEIIQNRSSDLRDLGVRKIGLFGSVMRGDDKDTSDVDVLVEFEVGQKTFDRLFALHELLRTAFGCNVDLVTRKSLSPVIGPKILENVEYVEIPV